MPKTNRLKKQLTTKPNYASGVGQSDEMKPFFVMELGSRFF